MKYTILQSDEQGELYDIINRPPLPGEVEDADDRG
jgi:hypothetical protein